MSDETEALVRRYYKHLTDSEWPELSQMLSDTVTYDSPTIQADGRENLVKSLSNWRNAFVNLRFDVMYVMSADSMTAARLAVRGTRESHSLLNEPPIQNISYQAMTTFEVEDGAIRSIRSYFDPTVIYSEMAAPCGMEIR